MNPLARIRQLITILTSTAVLLFTNSLFAGGFHYEIDANTHLVSDKSAHIKGLKMVWVYDTTISKMIIEDEDLTPEKREQTLETVAHLMLADLDSINYFTSAIINNKPVIFAEVTEHQLEVLDNKQLKLTFFLPFKPSYPSNKMTFDLALADPAGAGIVIYTDKQSITLDKTLQSQCSHSLINHDEFEHGQAAQLVKISCQ